MLHKDSKIRANIDYGDMSMHASAVQSNEVSNLNRKPHADIGRRQVRNLASDWDECM
jgi:hypothetical protein